MPFEQVVQGLKISLLWFSMPFAFFLKLGWLACPMPNQQCISATCRICWFGIGLWSLTFQWLIQSSSTYSVLAMSEGNVDCLLMAMLVATSTFENPPQSSQLGADWRVVLSEDHNFCYEQQEANGSEMMWDWGTRWGMLIWCGSEWLLSLGLVLDWCAWKEDELLTESNLGGQGKVVTWLILPVVICLSQRLSHACPSINNFVLWNCEWLIKSVIVYLMLHCYMDNCGNSRANTCNQAPTSGRGVFIR